MFRSCFDFHNSVGGDLRVGFDVSTVMAIRAPVSQWTPSGSYSVLTPLLRDTTTRATVSLIQIPLEPRGKASPAGFDF
jgi:hypothetical protein